MSQNIPLNDEYLTFWEKVEKLICPLCGSPLKFSDKETEHAGGVTIECSSSSCSFSHDEGID